MTEVADARRCGLFCCADGNRDIRRGLGAGTAPCEMATKVASEAIKRAGLNQTQCINRSSTMSSTPNRAACIRRVAAIVARVPETMPALTLNRLCGSVLQAVVSGAEQIMLGNAGVVLTGGAENMSRVGHVLSKARFGAKMGDVTAIDLMTGALTGPRRTPWPWKVTAVPPPR